MATPMLELSSWCSGPLGVGCDVRMWLLLAVSFRTNH